MYILDPSLDEDASGALMGKIEDLMNKQGVEVEKIEPWGKRRLAYSIKGHRDGTYILSYLKAEPTAISEMERRLRVTDGILRFLTVRMDEQQAKLERRKARADDKSVARRQRKAARTPSPPEEKAASPVEAKPEAEASGPGPAEAPAASDDTEKES
jgi:small subunit ribosomal protein S6